MLLTPSWEEERDVPCDGSSALPEESIDGEAVN